MSYWGVKGFLLVCLGGEGLLWWMVAGVGVDNNGESWRSGMLSIVKARKTGRDRASCSKDICFRRNRVSNASGLKVSANTHAR